MAIVEIRSQVDSSTRLGYLFVVDSMSVEDAFDHAHHIPSNP